MDLGLSYSEIALILVIALIVIGPRRMPELFRTFGKVMGQLRRMSDDLRREVLFSDEMRSIKKTMDQTINPPPVPPRLKLKPAETPAEPGAEAASAAPGAAAEVQKPGDAG